MLQRIIDNNPLVLQPVQGLAGNTHCASGHHLISNNKFALTLGT